MTNASKPIDYYVATEDGNHFVVFEETKLIFEALAAYYQAVNDGPEDIYIEIEMGFYDLIDEEDFEHKPLLFHTFPEIN
jgi:hypothetical protein